MRKFPKEGCGSVTLKTAVAGAEFRFTPQSLAKKGTAARLLRAAVPFSMETSVVFST